jgi:hypothetical protein
MRSLSFSIMLAIYAVASAAVAHTMNETECHAFAWDAKQEAFDVKNASLKMQLGVMATTLEICRDPAHRLTCIYKDDEDDAQAISTLNWIYGNLTLSAKQVHDIVESNCKERLMESLRQSHGVPNKD